MKKQVSAAEVAYVLWLDEFEKKAEKQIKKDRVNEMVASGIDRDIAKVYADLGIMLELD